MSSYSESSATLEEISVTSSRIQRAGYVAPTPITTITAEDFANTGTTNLGQALVELPAFIGSIAPSTTALYTNLGGANIPDLRGLGPTRTLVLVNGRRHVGQTPDGTVDLNIIPSSMISRIEVVTGGASAAWGSDAVSGVVNIIFDNELEGVKLDAQYGQSTHGDGTEYRATMAFGDSFSDDRGHYTLAGEYHRNEGVGPQRDRDWSSKGWAIIGNPAFQPGNGQPARILAQDVNFSIATEGGYILSPAPVAGLQFGPGGTVLPLNRGIVSGTNMIGGDGADMGQYTTLSVPYDRKNLYLSADYDVNDSVNAFIEAGYAQSHSRNEIIQTFDLAGITIQSDNAFIPAELGATLQANNISSFRMARVNTDLGFFIADVRTSTFRTLAGLRGRIFDRWDWETSFQHGEALLETVHRDRITANFQLAVDAVRDPATGQIVCRSALNAASLPTGLQAAARNCVPLNLFGNGSPSPSAVSYVQGFGVGRQRNTQEVVTASIGGDAFELWAGPLSIAAGGEYRKETLDADTDPVSAAGGFFVGSNQLLQGEIVAKELFAEAALPLANNLPLLRSLDLNGAFRHTDYSSSGSVETWKLGLTWRPIQSLMLRGTVSRDIRAPNISELFTSGRPALFTPADPCVAAGQASSPAIAANCQAAGLPADFVSNVVSIPQLRVGNAALEPEIAKSYTMGFVYSPQWLPSFKASFDWYDIKVREVIGVIGGQNILNMCYVQGRGDMCQLVSRDPSGQLTNILNRTSNIALTRLSGYDLALDYGFDLSSWFAGASGKLNLGLTGSYVYEKSDAPLGTTSTNHAGEVLLLTGVSATTVGVPKLRLNANASYSNGAFGASLRTRYIGQSRYNNTWSKLDYDHNDVPAVWYFDASSRYELDIGQDSVVEVYGGVNNLLDKDPPVIPLIFPAAVATNGTHYDVVGRYVYGGMRIRF